MKDTIELSNEDDGLRLGIVVKRMMNTRHSSAGKQIYIWEFCNLDLITYNVR
jgi:hypothetical protein